MTPNTELLAAIEWGTLWSAVSAIATAVTAVAILIAIRQLRFEAWLKAQEIFTEKGFTEARGKVFGRLEQSRTDWTDDERRLGLDVCRKMTELCDLVDFLGTRRTLDAWDDPIAKAWVVLEPLIVEERKRCGWPTKWHSFENTARLALVRLARNGRTPRKKSDDATANAA